MPYLHSSCTTAKLVLKYWTQDDILLLLHRYLTISFSNLSLRTLFALMFFFCFATSFTTKRALTSVQDAGGWLDDAKRTIWKETFSRLMVSAHSDNWDYLGNGCGSVGRAVTSNTRGQQFDSSHWQNIYRTFVYYKLYWKDER